jgi:hypothetical protein
MNTYVWPNYYIGPTFQAEVNWLKDWITNRANWLDENLPQLITGTEDYGSSVKIEVFPNPFSSAFQVHYKSKNQHLISVQVFNATGSLVEVRDLPSEQDGVFQGTVGNSLPNGFYLYRVFSAGKEIAAGKVFKR